MERLHQAKPAAVPKSKAAPAQAAARKDIVKQELLAQAEKGAEKRKAEAMTNAAAELPSSLVAATASSAARAGARLAEATKAAPTKTAAAPVSQPTPPAPTPLAPPAAQPTTQTPPSTQASQQQLVVTQPQPQPAPTLSVPVRPAAKPVQGWWSSIFGKSTVGPALGKQLGGVVATASAAVVAAAGGTNPPQPMLAPSTPAKSVSTKKLAFSPLTSEIISSSPLVELNPNLPRRSILSPPSALKHTTATAPPPPRPAPVVQSPPPPPESPQPQYSISPYRSDSDEDEDSEADRIRETKIPKWARGSRLTQALERQARSNIDPDTIFLSQKTCDLKDIFGEPKSRKSKKRGSSENWNRDGLTANEDQQYKRKMGFLM